MRVSAIGLRSLVESLLHESPIGYPRKQWQTGVGGPSKPAGPGPLSSDQLNAHFPEAWGTMRKLVRDEIDEAVREWQNEGFNTDPFSLAVDPGADPDEIEELSMRWPDALVLGRILGREPRYPEELTRHLDFELSADGSLVAKPSAAGLQAMHDLPEVFKQGVYRWDPASKSWTASIIP